MKCKACKNEIPNGSVFCMYCGQKLVKDKKKEISVPKPRQMPSGAWTAQLMVAGNRVSVSAATEKEYYAKARAMKVGLIEMKGSHPAVTLRDAIKEYIDAIEPATPPSSIDGYKKILRNRCPNYMDADIWSINWQQLINDEIAHGYAPKTVHNTWNTVSIAVKRKGVELPDVKLPDFVDPDGDFLDYEQVKVFMRQIRGSRSEVAALLALHGLRASEIIPLTRDSIKKGEIWVRGATVKGPDGYVYKEANKNSHSRREVPIMIPRLLEILPASGKLVTEEPWIWAKDIRKACIAAGLPECSPHDMRRTFASLAYHLGWKDRTTMLVGGWTSMNTVNKVYKKLSQGDVKADVKSMNDFFSESIY